VNPARPLVSAIIPTHNHGHCLSRALDSVLAQEGLGERFEVEIIVVDDASTDATAEVIRGYPQVRYLPLDHRQGVSAARNAGIRAGSGIYIAFLDADDTWLPCKLRVQVPLLQANPEIGVVYSQSIRREAWQERLFPEASRAPSGRVFEAMVVYNFAAHCASLLIRREAFDRAGYFDESLVTSEDNDMALRLAFHFKFLFEPVPVSIYNISPHGSWLTHVESGGSGADYRRAIEKALRLLPDSPQADKIREEAPIRIVMHAVSPWVLVGDLAKARAELLKALRAYPSSIRLAWVRSRIKWVSRQLLQKAASPLVEARDFCAHIKAATTAGRVDARLATRWLLAEIWADVVLSEALRSRVGRSGAAYAAACAIAYAPSNVRLALRMGRGLLKR
jgi:glycosyltransferase involved in cell wall biosynthesis